MVPDCECPAVRFVHHFEKRYVMRRRKHTAFTLIELLVVISIIALSISILLPALQKAKRQARVLSCMSILKSVGVGLTGYVADNNGNYPTPVTGSLNVIYGNGFVADHRQNLKVIANGMTEEVWWCPLQQSNRPSINTKETEWSRDFNLCSSNGNWHCVGYNMFFLIGPGSEQMLGGAQWNYEHTTNPDLNGDGRRDGPYKPGNPDSAVVADTNVDWQTGSGGCGNWEKPYFSSHVDIIKGCIAPPDSDVLFGDGHVTMATKLKYYYFRAHAKGTYAY